MAVKGATRLASTKCAPNQMTAPEMTGYDAETGKLVAAELGVEPCFVTAPWDQVIAGNWGDQWDVAWGSGALDASRMSALYVTQPYYTTPANFFVLARLVRTRSPSDLYGKQIGACSGCTHEQYLQGTLTLPGESLSPLVANPKLVTYASEIARPRRCCRRQDRCLPVQPAGRRGRDQVGLACGCSTRPPSTPTRPATSIAA